MFRPPFLARVAAGAAVYVLEETRRLPSAAAHFPVTAISQLLQTGMHLQQFVTSLAIKGDAVFDRFTNRPVEQPEWATFDEDLSSDSGNSTDSDNSTTRDSGFDRFVSDPDEVELALAETLAGLRALQNQTSGNSGETTTAVAEDDETPTDNLATEAEASAPPATDRHDNTVDAASTESEPRLPEVAARFDYPNMSLAQLRGRLRTLTLDDLTALLEYEEQTRARAAFVTMLTNRIATVRAR
ncbi:lipid droplet-associated protein [Nocardia paucivorans]|uniref:lipid droplet-associated protein n=1 Tax=Nocardia paucivorans TaxID=114259 RepID=UPI0002EEF23D|nr:lipid droplet-associated protein [Nocardia paucivorans]